MPVPGVFSTIFKRRFSLSSSFKAK